MGREVGEALFLYMLDVKLRSKIEKHNLWGSTAWCKIQRLTLGETKECGGGKLFEKNTSCFRCSKRKVEFLLKYIIFWGKNIRVIWMVFSWVLEDGNKFEAPTLLRFPQSLDCEANRFCFCPWQKNLNCVFEPHSYSLSMFLFPSLLLSLELEGMVRPNSAQPSNSDTLGKQPEMLMWTNKWYGDSKFSNWKPISLLSSRDIMRISYQQRKSITICNI